MNDVDTSNGLTQLLNEIDKEVPGAEYKETTSHSLVAIRSDICLSQRSIVGTDDNKSLIDPIVSDINWFETVNNNEMEIEFSNEIETLQIKTLSSDVLSVSKEIFNSNVDCSTNRICSSTILFTTPVKSKKLFLAGIIIPLSPTFLLATERIDDNELNENVSLNNRIEKSATLLNKNVSINVEIDSKAFTQY